MAFVMFVGWLHITVVGHQNGEYFELHWYEHAGLGKFEVKQVRVNRS